MRAERLVALAGVLRQVDARAEHAARRAAGPLHTEKVTGDALRGLGVRAVEEVALIDGLEA